MAAYPRCAGQAGGGADREPAQPEFYLGAESPKSRPTGAGALVYPTACPDPEQSEGEGSAARGVGLPRLADINSGRLCRNTLPDNKTYLW